MGKAMASYPSTILILTNSKDATADYLASVLGRHGLDVIRWDTDKLLGQAQLRYSIGAPRVCWNGKWYCPDDIATVWNRRPERLTHPGFGTTPEDTFVLDEWSETIEGFLCHVDILRWINHPSCNAAAAHKLGQLTTAHRLGFTVPNTLVTQDSEQLKIFFEDNDRSIIAKPLSKGHIEQAGDAPDCLIYTNRVEPEHLKKINDLADCPTMFQKYIPKISDIRLTVVDGDFHAIELRAEEYGVQRCDIRRNQMQDVKYSKVQMPDGIRLHVCNIMKHYNLRFAAIDFAVSDDGVWYFLEINPNGQWAWMDLEGVSNIALSFVRSFSA